MNLKDFTGMNWDEARVALDASLPLLALSDDKMTRECGIAIRDGGVDAGIATLCAFLFMEEYGAVGTIRYGIGIYNEIMAGMEKEGKDVSWTKGRLNDMDYWMAWIGPGGPRKKEIKPPIEFPYKDYDRRAGLANIMLWVGVMHIEGGNTHLIAADSVVRFLREGVERKRASNDRRKSRKDTARA